MARNTQVAADLNAPPVTRTLAKFVMDLLRTNPAIYDGVALFAPQASYGGVQGLCEFVAAEREKVCAGDRPVKACFS